MNVTIWHNPRCSKSRATLQLLQEHGVAPDIRLYQQDAPSIQDIRKALEMLGVSADMLIRKGEPEYREAGLTGASSDDDLIAAMAEFPKLIERPVVFANGKAKMGRPPESVLDILET